MRAGVLNRIDDRWRFTHSGIERLLAAEYAYDQVLTSLHPQRRELMKWTAALVARRGSDHAQGRFFEQLQTALGTASPLSYLEVADYLVEFRNAGILVDPQFADKVTLGLRDLTKIESAQVRSAVAQRAARLGIDVDVLGLRPSSFEVIRPVELAPWARDLPGLLRASGLQPPQGDERKWLEDRRGMNTLVQTLSDANTPDLKWRCAAWLQQSSLSKVITIQIHTKALWRSRALPALEVLAQLAMATDTDASTALAARSVLCKDEFIVQLWQKGNEYTALVYDLLLALDKRLFVASLLPNQSEWRVYG